MATETNTFSPNCIDRRAFEASLYAPPGKHPETPTLCTAPITVGRRMAAEKGWQLIEGTAAWADPAGLVNRRTYEELRDEILGQLRSALPVDAVVLGLHGAMVSDGYEDTEGDLLTRMREILGPDCSSASSSTRTALSPKNASQPPISSSSSRNSRTRISSIAPKTSGASPSTRSKGASDLSCRCSIAR